jgi:hypothetical protein
MPFQAAVLLLYPDLLVVCLCATLISHATFATARKNKAELLSIFRLYTTANHLTHNVLVELPEQQQQTIGEPSVLPCCSYLSAFVPKGVTCCDACSEPPRNCRHLCADDRVEHYACRCRCCRPRVHPACPFCPSCPELAAEGFPSACMRERCPELWLACHVAVVTSHAPTHTRSSRWWNQSRAFGLLETDPVFLWPY